MKGKIFNANEELDLKKNFKKEVFENIVKFWDNYYRAEDLLSFAFKMAVYKFPDVALFAPHYSWQDMHSIELRVSLKINGISHKRPVLNSHIEQLLNERVNIFFEKPWYDNLCKVMREFFGDK